MAAPVDAGRATYDGSTSTNSHNVTLPGSIASGDFLIMAIRTATGQTLNAVSGWTQLASSGSDGSDDNQYILARLADGTEGATQTVTFSSNVRIAAITWRATGTATLGYYVDNYNGAFLSGGSTTTPDGGPPIAYHGDALVFSIVGISAAHTITNPPTGYGNSTGVTSTGATGTGQCTLIGATKQVTGGTGGTENPGAWTVSPGNVYMAATVIVATEGAYARLTAEPVEVAVLPDTQKARLTAAPVEVAITTRPPLRLTQEPVEVVAQPDTQKLRLTQEPVEVVAQPDNQKVRLTQEPVEVLLNPDGRKLRLTQLVVEVIKETVVVTAQDFQAFVID